MEQYIESFKITNNKNPDQVEQDIIEFYPELKQMFDALEEILKCKKN